MKQLKGFILFWHLQLVPIDTSARQLTKHLLPLFFYSFFRHIANTSDRHLTNNWTSLETSTNIRLVYTYSRHLSTHGCFRSKLSLDCYQTQVSLAANLAFKTRHRCLSQQAEPEKPDTSVSRSKPSLSNQTQVSLAASLALTTRHRCLSQQA